MARHFLSAKVSPEWRLKLGFGTHKKCPFPLKKKVRVDYTTGSRGKRLYFFFHQLKYFLNLILEATTATLEYLLLLLFGGKTHSFMMKSSNLNDFHCTWTSLTKLKELKESPVFLVAYNENCLTTFEFKS